MGFIIFNFVVLYYDHTVAPFKPTEAYVKLIIKGWLFIYVVVGYGLHNEVYNQKQLFIFVLKVASCIEN